MVAGLWLLQLNRVWYNLPVLFPGFSAFLSPAAWVTPVPAFRKGAESRVVWQHPATVLDLTPQSGDLKALERGLNGTEGDSVQPELNQNQFSYISIKSRLQLNQNIVF